MKSKLRKIAVDETNYLYSVKDSYTRSSKDLEASWTTTVRVFKDGCKNTPLELLFVTKDEYITGNPLKSNYSIDRNGESHEFNIYRPWLISLLIREGLNKNWTGVNRLTINDGMRLLQEMNFDISKLLPEKKGEVTD